MIVCACHKTLFEIYFPIDIPTYIPLYLFDLQTLGRCSRWLLGEKLHLSAYATNSFL